MGPQESVQNVLPFKHLLGWIDEKGGSLLGELTWARVTPSWLLASPQNTSTIATDSFGTQKNELKSSSDFLVAAAVSAVGLGVALTMGLAVKGAVEMSVWKRKLRDSESNGVAYGPKPLPILGNLLELRKGYYETLYAFLERPAAVFWVLSTPFVVVNDAECVRTVLGGAGGRFLKPKYFGYRSRTVEKAVQAEQENVAAESATLDPKGDSSRVALNAMVQSSFETIRSSMDRLVDLMADASDRIDVEQNHEDALSVVRRSLVSLNLDVLFGMSQGVVDASRAADMIAFAGTEFARRMVNPLRILVDIPGNLKYLRDVGGLIGLGRQLCLKLDEVAVSMKGGVETLKVGERSPPEASGATSGLGWVHAWVGKVGKVGKLGKVVGLLMASSQTVPITAVWMLHLVAKHSHIQEQLRRELNDIGVRSVSDLTFEAVGKMQKAEAVILETLRLYPPFPLIQREAQVDTTLGGITVPRGTPVYVVPWLIHRNPKLWPSPHEFRPNRFSKVSMSHGDAPSDWAFLPFGRGPRMCVGSQLALVELKVLLALSLLRLEWLEPRKSSGGEGEGDDDDDSIFPELGMLPKNVRLFCKRVSKEMELENAL